MQTEFATAIVATKVDARARMAFLPKYFGKSMMIFEGSVFNVMGNMCADYTGGSWDFMELSNGGAYMRPREGSYTLSCSGNYFEGEMSADAAGIVVCLFVLSHLSCKYQDNDTLCELFADRFHQIRAYAGDHAEASVIFAAID